MAEIRSTMAMVLERAERLAAAAGSTDSAEEVTKTGMRLAADFLSGKQADLVSQLQSQAETAQPAVRKGMVQTLLRNIVLPRDPQLLETSKKAIEALIMLAGQGKDIFPICRELGQLLDQYEQHKEQSVRQLDEAIRAQLSQGQQRMGGDIQADINPAMHPQYREELNRMITSLNTQYTQAFEQRKQLILQQII